MAGQILLNPMNPEGFLNVPVFYRDLSWCLIFIMLDFVRFHFMYPDFPCFDESHQTFESALFLCFIKAATTASYYQ